MELLYWAAVCSYAVIFGLIATGVAKCVIDYRNKKQEERINQLKLRLDRMNVWRYSRGSK